MIHSRSEKTFVNKYNYFQDSADPRNIAVTNMHAVYDEKYEKLQEDLRLA